MAETILSRSALDRDMSIWGVAPFGNAPCYSR
jgi:hypothetical protein